MKKTIASVLVAIMTILCIGGGYSESDALSGGIEAEEIIPDQLPEPEQESEEDMATGDKLANLDDLKVSHDKNQGDISDLKSALSEGADSGYTEIASYEDTLKPLLGRGNFQRNVYAPNTGAVNLMPNRITARRPIVFPYDVTITAKTGFRFYPHLYNESTGQWEGIGWKTAMAMPANTPFYCQIGRATEDASEIADVSVFLSAITVSGNPIEKEVNEIRTDVDLMFKTDNSDLASVLINGTLGIKSRKVVVGLYDPRTDGINHSFDYRASTCKPIKFPYATKLIIADGYQCYPYHINGSSIISPGWRTGEFTLEANTEYYFQIELYPENTSAVADADVYSSAITIEGFNLQKVFETVADLDFILVEQGQWTYGSKTSTIYRLRTEKLISVNEGDTILYSVGDLIANICYMESSEASSWTVTSATGTGKYTASADGVVAINIKNAGETAISKSDFEGAFIAPGAFGNIILNNNGSGDTEYNSKLPAITNGKHVYIYQFGGKGNDWCFVRTPSGYDHKDKGKACPFVICNHGNGWIMNGTIQMANWTKRTMYVPLDDPDYIADPTEYNGTSDESLWYSNPTIEALLSAGYVVCGCENYGDGLFGNNNCRNACVDFFYHMVENWNVQDRCYMIGASNGAMTSLNAAYLLQGKVEAIVLQYPLTCLVNQYEHYPNHQAAIRAAYGITDADITIAELTKAVATHDPLTVDVVSGQKVGVFPPVKLYYSPQDDVVNYQYNSLALATMLDNSNKVVETVECSGEHGDHTHFAPADYVAWFNAN